MKTVSLSVTFILLIVLYHQVDGVGQCYKCVGGCDFPSIEGCPPPEIALCNCYSAKIIQPPDGRIEYAKGCVLADDTNMLTECEVINNNGGSCYICNTELCNDHD